MQKITPFLWYEKDAPGVVRYYQSIFGTDNVVIVDGEDIDNTPSGDVRVVTVKIFGLEMNIMTAGPHDPFNDAISFVVTCADQEEIDRYWYALTKDGREQQCGWCSDKYGVRWQIIPNNMSQYISTEAGMKSMLSMKKIVIDDLKKI